MTFAETEAEYRRLKAQFDAGALSEADFKAQLQALMVEDDQGRWWIIGYDTGQWYVHDGEQWTPGAPHRPSGPPSSVRGIAVAPLTVLWSGLALALAVGYGIGRWTYSRLYIAPQTTGEVSGAIAGLVAALSGTLITLALADRARPGHHLPLAWIGRALAGWLICLTLAGGQGWLIYKAFVNSENFTGEALALTVGGVIALGGALWLAWIIRRNRSSR